MFNPSSAQDLINAGFFGYQGWSDTEAVADFKATGGQGKGSFTGGGAEQGQVLGGSGGGDLIDLQRRSLELTKEFNKPGIETLQGAIGGIKERYAKLLETFQPQAETTRTNEFGRRGIPISSTSAQEGIQKAGRDVATGLAAQEQQDITPLQTAIASLQSGGGGNVLGSAIDLQRLSESRRQFDINDQFRRIEQPSGGSGGGGVFAPTNFEHIFDQPDVPPSGITQSVTGGSTSNLSGADLFRQRVLSGQVGEPTITTEKQPGNFFSRLFNFG